MEVTIGDLYVYNYCNEDHIVEVTSVDRGSGMSSVKIVAGSYKGTEMWVRPDLLVELAGNEEETQNGCQCGAKHTSNPKFHLRYCKMAKDNK